MEKRFRSRDQTVYAFGMRQPFGKNFVPNTGKIYGLLLSVRIWLPKSSENQKWGLHSNLVVSSAGIWELLEPSAPCSFKRSARFLLVGGWR